MLESTHFCRKRLSHLKDLMTESNIEFVILLKKSVPRAQYNFFKRLVNTPFGSAVLVPLDDDPFLLCSTGTVFDVGDDACVSVRDKGVKGVEEYIIDYVNGQNFTKIGINMNVLNIKSHKIYSEEFQDIIDISKTLIPKVFFGLYPQEIENQRVACRIADIGAEAIHSNLKPGITEIELVAEANYAMFKAGCQSLKFHTIVSSGERSARIHSFPTERKLREGDLVLVDMGPIRDGYSADISRTFLVGSDPSKQKMIDAVDESVQSVIDAIKPGESCLELDAMSRRVLQRHGYPDYPHSLGHSLSGFSGPGLSKRSTTIMEVGMVHTVEPGIYLKGIGGVRIEENVVVTENGCKVLTKCPRIF